MFKRILLAASTVAVTAVAVPGAAQAGHRQYNSYDRYNSYNQPYYGQQGYGYAPNYGYQQPYYGRRYYGQRRQRCGKGTTGLIVGGAAGALLGREIERGSNRNRYYGERRGGTTGAIIGGALGALVGREVARSC